MTPGWQRACFDDVISDESGGNVKTPQSEFLAAGRYPVVDQGKDLIAGYVNEDRRLCRAQLPVILFGDHTRSFKYVDFPFCIGADGVKVLRPKADADVKYLFHYFRQLRLTEGGYDRHFKYLKRADVDLPPLGEQRRIAQVLDYAEALRAKRRVALAELDAFTQSVFHDMFGDPATNPKGWPITKLGSEIESVRYGTGSPPEYVEDGVPFIRATNIKNETITSNDLRRISLKDAARLEKCRVRYGDLIVVRSGVNTGDCAMVSREYDGACAAFDLIIELSREKAVFYSFVINSAFGKRCLFPLTRRAAQPHLNAFQFRTLSFISPPRSLKEEFASRVVAVEGLKAIHRTSLAGLDALFASLQLHAFRGELWR